MAETIARTASRRAEPQLLFVAEPWILGKAFLVTTTDWFIRRGPGDGPHHLWTRSLLTLEHQSYTVLRVTCILITNNLNNILPLFSPWLFCQVVASKAMKKKKKKNKKKNGLKALHSTVSLKLQNWPWTFSLSLFTPILLKKKIPLGPDVPSTLLENSIPFQMF